MSMAYHTNKSNANLTLSMNNSNNDACKHHSYYITVAGPTHLYNSIAFDWSCHTGMEVWRGNGVHGAPIWDWRRTAI